MAFLISKMRLLCTLCGLLLTFPLVSSKAKHQLKHDVVDAFKVFEHFPYAVAVHDMDQDGEFDCTTAIRTELNSEPQQATYIFFLNGPNAHPPRNITYHVQPGATPDTTVFTINDDYEHSLGAHFMYTDYKNCVVMEFPFDDRQECLLWVASDVKDDIPQGCTDEYRDNCDDGVKAYDKESCGGLFY